MWGFDFLGRRGHSAALGLFQRPWWNRFQGYGFPILLPVLRQAQATVTYSLCFVDPGRGCGRHCFHCGKAEPSQTGWHLRLSRRQNGRWILIVHWNGRRTGSHSGWTDGCLYLSSYWRLQTVYSDCFVRTSDFVQKIDWNGFANSLRSSCCSDCRKRCWNLQHNAVCWLHRYSCWRNDNLHPPDGRHCLAEMEILIQTPCGLRRKGRYGLLS